MSNDHELGIVPVDQMVGGDGDTPGLSQPITIDEVQDIAMSERSLEERKMRLREIRFDLVQRAAGDTGNEFDALIAEVDRYLEMLEGPGDVVAMRDSVGLARDERVNEAERERTDGTPDAA